MRMLKNAKLQTKAKCHFRALSTRPDWRFARLRPPAGDPPTPPAKIVRLPLDQGIVAYAIVVSIRPETSSQSFFTSVRKEGVW